MSTNNIKNKLKRVSKSDNTWIKKAKYRQENKAWLDISFAIAVKIKSKLEENKKSKEFPKSQKELAEALGCSPQYVNKLLKGTENLQLETITRIERILSIHLIQVPQFETTFILDTDNTMAYSKPEEILKSEVSITSYQEVLDAVITYDYELESTLKIADYDY